MCIVFLHFNLIYSFSVRMSSSSASRPQFTNRLAQEKSPYLLQHAHNPVNWQVHCVVITSVDIHAYIQYAIITLLMFIYLLSCIFTYVLNFIWDGLETKPTRRKKLLKIYVITAIYLVLTNCSLQNVDCNHRFPHHTPKYIISLHLNYKNYETFLFLYIYPPLDFRPPNQHMPSPSNLCHLQQLPPRLFPHLSFLYVILPLCIFKPPFLHYRFQRKDISVLLFFFFFL